MFTHSIFSLSVSIKANNMFDLYQSQVIKLYKKTLSTFNKITIVQWETISVLNIHLKFLRQNYPPGKPVRSTFLCRSRQTFRNYLAVVKHPRMFLIKFYLNFSSEFVKTLWETVPHTHFDLFAAVNLKTLWKKYNIVYKVYSVKKINS